MSDMNFEQSNVSFPATDDPCVGLFQPREDLGASAGGDRRLDPESRAEQQSVSSNSSSSAAICSVRPSYTRNEACKVIKNPGWQLCIQVLENISGTDRFFST